MSLTKYVPGEDEKAASAHPMSNAAESNAAESNAQSIAPVSKTPQPTTPELATPNSARVFQTQKRLVVAIVTVAGFLGPVAGNIYIPLLPLYQTVFNTSPTAINGTVSVFMFTFGVAPLFWASLADKFGRRPLFLISLPFYIVSAVFLAAVPPNIGALYFLRVVQAFGASSLISLGAAAITDVVEQKKRARAISYFLLGPQLGPILGLVLSLVGSQGKWRWTFGILAIFSGVIFGVIFLFLPETQGASGSSKGNSGASKDECGTSKRESAASKSAARISLNRYLVPRAEMFRIGVVPAKKHPSTPKIVWTVVSHWPIVWSSVIGAFLFASFYSVSVSLSSVLRNQYLFSQTNVSVSYICPSVALVAGSLLTGKISDFLQLKGTNPDRSPHHPERRLILQSGALLVCIGGLTCFGWAVEHHWHVAAVFVFTFMVSFGMSSVSVVNMTYLTECPTGYVSTNVAVGNMARNLAAGVASLIVDKLCGAMGYGWYFSGLALLNVVSIAMSVALCKYGGRWNRK